MQSSSISTNSSNSAFLNPLKEPAQIEDLIKTLTVTESKTQNIFNRICQEPYVYYHEIQERIKNGLSAPPYFPSLTLCPCLKMEENMRVNLENQVITLLKNKDPKQRLRIVSVGAGGCYQEAVYLAKLAAAKFQSIDVTLIDVDSVPKLALDRFCKANLPSSCRVQTEYYNNLKKYAKEASKKKNLRPDLLLLIDISNSQYKVGGLALPEYAFNLFKEEQLLSKNPVIAYSALNIKTDINTKTQEITPTAIACIYDNQHDKEAYCLNQVQRQARHTFSGQTTLHSKT